MADVESGQEPGKKLVELKSAPGALTAYRRAVLQRAHGKDRVPEKVLKLTGVTPELDHVTAYLNVCGGRLGDSLPLLYPHMLGFPLQMALLTDGASPFAAMGLVHVLNSATQLKPLPLSAALDIEAEMAAPKLHARGRTIDLLVRASIDGELVWHSSSTYLKRESTKDRVVEIVNVGKASPEALLTRPGALWRLPSDLGRQYGEVSGDRNPIHMYGLSAKLFGFNSAIAHGMWTAARSLAALEGRVPDAVRNDVEFKQPIPLPGTVEFADDGGYAGAKELDFVVRARKPRKDGSTKLHLVGSVSAL